MDMEKEYIKIKTPSSFSADRNVLKTLDDIFWKNEIFRYLISFYKNIDEAELKQKIETEKKQPNPRIERKIAYYIRKTLNNNTDFAEDFYAFGENTNDEEIEGYYDITIHSTNWKSKNFHFECKNLNKKQDSINKYVYCNKGKQIFDGGVYRYFNGKYAQNQDFGGMIGFVLEGNLSTIKNKILNKLQETKTHTNFIKFKDNSIENNDFTFDSYHTRDNSEFLIHHLLFNICQ